MKARSFGRRAAELGCSLVPAEMGFVDRASTLGDDIKARIRKELLARIDPVAVTAMDRQRLSEAVHRLVSDIATEHRAQLNAPEEAALAEELLDDMVGLGPLEALLHDEGVTDILVNGPTSIYVERGGRLEPTGLRFRDGTHVLNTAQRIAAAVGRRIDESSPIVDARLADGSRVNIVLPPVALNGVVISIRKFAKRSITLEVMAEQHNISLAMARLLEIAARARLNILISGGTGSGKTTLLNALSQMIDPKERIVTIEDAAELQLQQPHVVRLESRPRNLEGTGEISQRDLVCNALRMRPDRIIVGEVRGQEAFDMLQAMNTGHDGSISTLHANSPRDALVRLENMLMMSSFKLPLRAIRSQIVGAIDLIVQIERMRDGLRRVTRISEVVGLEGDVVTMQDLFSFRETGEGGDCVVGRFEAQRIRPRFSERIRPLGLERALLAALGIEP